MVELVPPSDRSPRRLVSALRSWDQPLRPDSVPVVCRLSSIVCRLTSAVVCRLPSWTVWRRLSLFILLIVAVRPGRVTLHVMNAAAVCLCSRSASPAGVEPGRTGAADPSAANADSRRRRRLQGVCRAAPSTVLSHARYWRHWADL